MPFKIINKQVLAEGVKCIDIAAPDIARKIRPGQFVSVSPEEDDEHLPLTVTHCDPIKGVISITFPETGEVIRKLGNLKINDPVFSVLGPLGRRADIQKEGVVVCVASGIGISQILPICRAYKGKGNKVIGIIGARTNTALMLEPQLRIVCDKLLVATEDGTYQRKGLASDALKDFLGGHDVQCVYAIGSAAMMRRVSDITGDKRIKTLVRLNPVMADCMGMCGSCRVKVAGKVILACIEGPEFNGHEVDYDDLEIRMNAYEESKIWGNPPSRPSSPNAGSKTLTRFLSGILKS